MSLFGRDEGDSGMKLIFGPDGKSHLAFKAGNMTFADGNAYASIGENAAVGTDGKAYLGVGNVVFGNDGQAHLKFGDNPTFMI